MAFSIQKATIWKRFSAFLFDFILTVILSIGFMLVFSSILHYDAHSNELTAYCKEIQTNIEEEYNLDLNFMQTEDYEKLTDEEKEPYEDALKAYNDALRTDAKVSAMLQKLFFLTLVMISLGFLFGILILDFILPLCLKNGQTLGKKIFGTAVMRSNSVKISNFVLFARSIFGVFVIETLFPIALIIMMYFGILGRLGIIIVFLLLCLQAGLLFFSHNRTTIHDLLADTIVVDMASQPIFDTQEEALAFIKAEQAREEQKKDSI